MTKYARLRPEKVIETLSTLSLRIEERFPDRGIGKVCQELTELAKVTSKRAEQISRPNTLLRLLVATVVLSGIGALAYIFYIIPQFKIQGGFNFFQGIEAIMNVIVLMGAALFSVWTLETRFKRHKSLNYLNELNAITHVIDMHQLTKDPSIITTNGKPTKNSPKREMTEFELVRYLDYCSEMLSLTAKLAAFYSQNFSDPAVVSAVKDIEQLTTNMSRKIWQKIILAQKNLDGVDNL